MLVKLRYRRREVDEERGTKREMETKHDMLVPIQICKMEVDGKKVAGK